MSGSIYNPGNFYAHLQNCKKQQ